MRKLGVSALAVAAALFAAPAALGESAQKIVPKQAMDVKTGEIVQPQPGVPAPGSAHDPAESDAEELQRQRAQRGKQIEALNLNPVLERLAFAASDPGFQKASLALSTHPNRYWVFVVEGVWLVVMLVLKFWLALRVKRPGLRVFHLLWTSVVYAVGAVGLIPWLLLGDLYWELIRGFLRIVGIGGL